MNPLRDSRYTRETVTPWPKPVPVRITLRDCWEIVGLTVACALIVLGLPLATLVLLWGAK